MATCWQCVFAMCWQCVGNAYTLFNVCFCEFFLARFRSLIEIRGAGALCKRLAQGSVKIVGNAYAADSWQVEQSSDDRYSPQEIDGHRKEATEKKTHGKFWGCSFQIDR